MLLIPYGTDAPLYRPPWGTLSLIFANVFLFFLQDVLVPESIYVLKFGSGLNPIQWVYCAFAHAGWGHLIGNMIFLFSFGIIVESMMKLRDFYLLYFAIVILKSFAVQVMMLGASGGALGASGAIFGLMLVAGICAPNRNVSWLFVFYYWVHTFQVPVLIVGVFYFMWDFGLAMFDGFAISTPMLHAMGGISGAVCGAIAYRLNMFELDGEDLVSRFKVLLGQEPNISEAHKQRIAKPEPKFERVYKFGKLTPQVAKLNKYLKLGKYNLAVMKLGQIKSEHGRFKLNESQLVKLINLAMKSKDFARAKQFMKDYLDRFEKHEVTIRLNLTRIEVIE